MRYIVRNLTRRPVSILCNSGKSYHLPPKYAHELASIEVDNNALVKKLCGRKILDVKPAGDGKDSAAKGKSESKKPAETARSKSTKGETDKDK